MILRGVRTAPRSSTSASPKWITTTCGSGPRSAVVAVATDGAHAERELQAVVDEIERHEPGLITRTEVEHLWPEPRPGSQPTEPLARVS